MPPEVEITSPEWFAQLDPRQASFQVRGSVFARGEPFTCEVHVAPGSYPNDRLTADGGDFEKRRLRGVRRHQGAHRRAERRARRRGRARPARALPGHRRRLRRPRARHRRADLRRAAEHLALRLLREGGGHARCRAADAPGRGPPQRLPAPRQRPARATSRWSSAPTAPPRRCSSTSTATTATSWCSAPPTASCTPSSATAPTLPGWPVRGDKLPVHAGGRAFSTGGVSENYGGAILASPAAGDLDRDGAPEIVAADLEGKVYAWNAEGERVLTEEANPAFSGKPLDAVRERAQGPAEPHPARLHRLAGARRPRRRRRRPRDRGRRRWTATSTRGTATGRPCDGYPVLVVDQGKVASADRPRHPRGHLRPGEDRRRAQPGRDRRHARGRRTSPATRTPRRRS